MALPFISSAVPFRPFSYLSQFLRQASSNGVRFIKEISQESNPSIYFTPDGSIGLGSMDELHTVQTSPNRISDTEPGQYFNHLDQDELYAKVAKMRDPNSRRVAHFELPNTKPKKQRKVRGVRRMNSLPSMVIAMPSKTKTTLGRFKITTIPEEAEAKDNISRKSSVASLRAMNQTVKLENTPGDYNVWTSGNVFHKQNNISQSNVWSPCKLIWIYEWIFLV